MPNAQPQRALPWWKLALLVLLTPVFLVFLSLALPLYLAYCACLRVAIWTAWNARGRDVLFVYSDSPTWHDYITANMLPRLAERAIILNWSQRKQWHLSLATLAFHHFGGSREFNPLAVVFRPFRRTRTLRFWQPFQDFKHGRPESLQRLQAEFFDLLDAK